MNPIKPPAFEKIQQLILKYGEVFGTPRSELDEILLAAKNNDLGSLDDAQKFLIWDAIGRNDANIDRTDLEFIYERLSRVIFPRAFKKRQR